MLKFATITKHIKWVVDGEEIPFNLIYTINNNEMVNDKFAQFLTALQTLTTNVGYNATLDTSGDVQINFGDTVTTVTTDPQMSITFNLERLSDYFNSFTSITGSRDDFLDFVNTYGLAVALERVFSLAIDEYNSSLATKTFVPTTIIITNILDNVI